MTRGDHPPPAPFGLKVYRAASGAAAPFARAVLKRRLGEGKEDKARLDERFGAAGRARPEGRLVWIHGASVGESLSVLPLVERLTARDPAASTLVTTGTVTSAKLMAERLPSQAFHQFIPVDHPRFAARFLDHWRPDIALFVESEFWPNLLMETRARTPFMALVNGRVSPRSFAAWSKRPRTIRYLLSQFDLLVAQDRQNAERLSALAARPVPSFGNLKNAAAPLPGDERALRALNAAIGGRPVLLAASTHPGEEETVIAAARLARADVPGLLAVVAPRHPARGAEVEAMAGGLNTARRAAGGAITPDTELYVADTLGELGVFYRAAGAAFVGGSLVDKGGHNPLEPARLGPAILHGPHVFNFAETYAELRGAGGAALVRNERELAAAARRLFADETTRGAMAAAAKKTAEASGERVLSDIVAAIDAARAQSRKVAE
ncbi:MAG TPA: 3-deoxy-D-manno-octulosonic acid transferase [Parvularcula sp.]|nr:3-deoxy-D-manno-octulosonic acid transferase [Parvularcula sp.]HBS30661.1 3-deoxy-D-manno-octulosonic acid transferase [Parvularcula sp.]